MYNNYIKTRRWKNPFTIWNSKVNSKYIFTISQPSQGYGEHNSQYEFCAFVFSISVNSISFCVWKVTCSSGRYQHYSQLLLWKLKLFEIAFISLRNCFKMMKFKWTCYNFIIKLGAKPMTPTASTSSLQGCSRITKI